jgi:flagellar basal body-associated protein FliL
MKANTNSMKKHDLQDTMSFKFIFLISYVVIFVVALILVVLPASQKSWLFAESDGASFFKSVESGVYSFMSYLN